MQSNDSSHVGAGSVRVIDMMTEDAMQRLPHRRPALGWTSLTSAERRLAELVGTGLTNKQVAARLFVSRHTVDAHLRHIFRKLEITSRVQLARVVATNTAPAVAHN